METPPQWLPAGRYRYAAAVHQWPCHDWWRAESPAARHAEIRSDLPGRQRLRRGAANFGVVDSGIDAKARDERHLWRGLRIPVRIDVKLVGRLEFRSGGVAMRYERRSSRSDSWRRRWSYLSRACSGLAASLLDRSLFPPLTLCTLSVVQASRCRFRSVSFDYLLGNEADPSQ